MELPVVQNDADNPLQPAQQPNQQICNDQDENGSVKRLKDISALSHQEILS